MRFVQILIISGAFRRGNYKDLDKTRVKLFPNFTRHHLITHTYFRAPSKIWRSFYTVARPWFIPVISQDQVCDSNHSECVLLSQSLIPRRNTKAYFLQHNAGCYQLCNNPRFPVHSQSMEVKIMRIDSGAHRLVRELIADCLGHLKLTFTVSWIKAMLSKMPLNYQRSSFTWSNCGFARVACMNVACEQVLSLRDSREATQEQHAKEDISARGGEREEECSSSHSVARSSQFLLAPWF